MNGRAGGRERGWWIVLVLARPKGGGRTLRGLMECLREHGARRLSPGAYLVLDVEGVGERLRGLARRAVESGGQVIIADSVFIEGKSAGR